MAENNFPAEFRKLRKTLDMTQQDVAELFDVSIKTVSNYESGTTRIPVERIEKLRSIAVQKSGIGRISYGLIFNKIRTGVIIPYIRSYEYYVILKTVFQSLSSRRKNCINAADFTADLPT